MPDTQMLIAHRLAIFRYDGKWKWRRMDNLPGDDPRCPSCYIHLDLGRIYVGITGYSFGLVQPYAFSVAAKMADIHVTRLRTWLDKYLIGMDKIGNKHRRFSEMDVLRLSIIAKLTDYGMEVNEAAKMSISMMRIRRLRHKLVKETRRVIFGTPGLSRIQR